MKAQKNIEYFITKFLNKEATKEDLLFLENELNEERLSTFNEFTKTNFISNTLMQKFDVDKAKLIVKNKIKKQQKAKRIILYKKLLASVAIIVFGLFIYNYNELYTYNQKLKSSSLVKQRIKPGTNKAILTLENGKNIVLEKNKNITLSNSVVKNEKIVYKNNQKVSKKEVIKYNYLTIPRGGQYFLTLSDGTNVWLNSESKIKYPVNFIKGSTREVTLLYGEAFFDVLPSSQYNGAKFKVHTQKQTVVVHGTEFNIKAYNNSKKIYTTLVEGSVSIHQENITKKLTPNNQAIATDKGITIKKVDVMYEIAWKNGLFMFYKQKLGDMLSSLSRWYNVEIIYKNNSKRNEIFSGLLKRTDNIEELLILLEKTGEVNFSIKGNKIFVQ